MARTLDEHVDVDFNMSLFFFFVVAAFYFSVTVGKIQSFCVLGKHYTAQ